MKNITYNNVPSSITSKDASIQAYDSYYEKPLEIDVATFDAIKGFFTSRGFDEVASESIALIIIRQAKKDNYKPLQIIDTLKGLDSVEISALVSEIINYNRYKTSFLGYAKDFNPNYEVQRNIIA